MARRPRYTPFVSSRPFSRLLSACLILLLSSGGGTLPVLDGLLFHSRDRGGETQRPHYEAASSCHADKCTLYSSAQQARFAPAVGAAARIVLDLERSFPIRPAPPAASQLHFGQPLSRAPPFFS